MSAPRTKAAQDLDAKMAAYFAKDGEHDRREAARAAAAAAKGMPAPRSNIQIERKPAAKRAVEKCEKKAPVEEGWEMVEEGGEKEEWEMVEAEKEEAWQGVTRKQADEREEEYSASGLRVGTLNGGLQ